MNFPIDRAGTRRVLLAAVDGMADVVRSHRTEAEANQALPQPVVDALRASGLFRMKSPRAVGGAEAHPADQMDVIEAVAQLDPAVAWTMFIGSAVTGSALAWLPDQAVGEIFASGQFPSMAGSLRPGGSARKVDGGWRISGQWAWGSGVAHADYVMVPVLVANERAVIRAVVPRGVVTLHDNWQVLGMNGTGSVDYSLDDVFVPEHFTTRTGAQLRGGALFRLGMPGFVVNEHGSIAYGIARLALDVTRELAVSKQRGYAAGQSIADRAVFQRAIGEGELRIHATRLLMHDVVNRLFDAAADGSPPAALQAEARAAAVRCTDEAIDVTATLFRYAGGSAVRLEHWLQRCLRDLYTVQSHLVVSDFAYENFGQIRLGLTDEMSLR